MKAIPFGAADVLLPKKDFEAWSVIACDQFTSRPDYWHETETIVGNKPSTLKLIFPEVYLESEDADERIKRIHSEMERYLAEGVYEEYKNALIYVERTQPDGRVRCGLVGAVDLEAYDYRPNAKSDIRATERTVLERIPPRVRIRRGAPTELPHVMMLIDDPGTQLKHTEERCPHFTHRVL